MATRTSVLGEVADSLALAVITSSTMPVVMLDGSLAVVAASASFCDAFQVDPVRAVGQPLAELGEGEWNVAQLRWLLKATAAGATEVDAYELDLKRKGQVRRLIVSARKLDYFDEENVRLVLSLSDVTEARIVEKQKDDLLREKAILLQELQHRVANSLQIIASVLMQSAKKVSSEETRGHLRDARNRVMSIATLQRQLAASRLGDVVLRDYFTELCESIGASMIRDRDHLSLEVSVDESLVKAEVSVSLGLIVTELVINALKHAFPRHRKGRILVDYRSRGTAWTLTVRDFGIGMPADHAEAKPGLGTGIVEALAGQLDANVEVTDATPGTMVSIVHALAPITMRATNLSEDEAGMLDLRWR